MRYRRMGIMALALCLLGAAVAAGCLAGCGRQQERPLPVGSALYRCPVHQEMIAGKPGECPMCGMDLVRMETPDPQESGRKAPAVSPAPAQTPPAPHGAEKKGGEISFDHQCTVHEAPVTVRIHIVPGERIFCPACGETILAENGKIEEIKLPPQDVPAALGVGAALSVDIPTKTVEAKDFRLGIRAAGLTVCDPELDEAQEAFLRALSSGQEAGDEARGRLERLGVSGEQIAGLEKSRRADAGIFVPGRGQNAWAYIVIREEDAAFVKTGALVELTAEAFPEKVFSGRVVWMPAGPDAQTQSRRARVEVVNKENRLRPQMRVNAKISVDLGQKPALPEKAVMDTGLRKIVYVSNGGSLFETRPVALGHRNGDFYEVIEGLSAGEMVAVEMFSPPPKRAEETQPSPSGPDAGEKIPEENAGQTPPSAGA